MARNGKINLSPNEEERCRIIKSETNQMQGMCGRHRGGQWTIGGRHGWSKPWNCWRIKQ